MSAWQEVGGRSLPVDRFKLDSSADLKTTCRLDNKSPRETIPAYSLYQSIVLKQLRWRIKNISNILEPELTTLFNHRGGTMLTVLLFH